MSGQERGEAVTVKCQLFRTWDVQCAWRGGRVGVGEGLVQARRLRQTESDAKFFTSTTCVKSCPLE